MRKDLIARLEALERDFGSAEITLTMESGQPRKINGKRLVPMLKEVLAGAALSEDTQAVLSAVSDDCATANGSRLTELLRVMQQAKLDAAEQVTQTERKEEEMIQ